MHSLPPVLTSDDLHLFNEGTHYRLYHKLGAHLCTVDGHSGTHFAVWAPNARQVWVFGSFNDWQKEQYPLAPVGASGIWAGFIAGIGPGAVYKYHIASQINGYQVEKADPIAFGAEVPPATASVVCDLAYDWGDGAWLAGRGRGVAPDAPISIYEVHLGSWMRKPEEGDRPLTYREAAPLLAAYVREMGFTHVELLPITEHPFYGSWGYQVSGYFAPTARYGGPTDFMHLVDTLHQSGIGVILDWVPAHFPADEHSLGFFDGTHLYEHADPRKGRHPDWGTLIFNYGRNEVRSFLMSSAMFWLDRYHVDGLRFDAVASMLYLDYSRQPGEWVPNPRGGRENLEAISLLQELNLQVARAYPAVITAAEESTAWPGVTTPPQDGGLGFTMKWDMGWMHDTLEYFKEDPLYRTYVHDRLTFRAVYGWTEHFMLPLSHDEVVFGKGSLLTKMPGDEWQRFANLRLLLGWMLITPGKKLLFMGSELAQGREWNHDRSLDWHLLAEPAHAGIRRWVQEINRLYRTQPALHQLDFDPAGFAWVDYQDRQQSVLSLLRRGRKGELLLAVASFTPVVRYGYRIGVPRPGAWRTLACSDAREYGGSGVQPAAPVQAEAVPAHGHDQSIVVDLPPLGVLLLMPD